MRDIDQELARPDRLDHGAAESFRAAALMRKRARRRMGAGVSAKRAALHAAALGVSVPERSGESPGPAPAMMASEKVDLRLSKRR